MNNGKLVMFIATSGPHMGKSVTNSDRGYTATGDSFRSGVYEQARFTIQTGRGEQKALAIRSMEVIDPKKEPQLAGVGMDMAPMENALTIKYTFSGEGVPEQLLCYISYYSFRSYGRKNKVPFLLHLLGRYLRSYLSH